MDFGRVVRIRTQLRLDTITSVHEHAGRVPREGDAHADHSAEAPARRQS